MVLKKKTVYRGSCHQGHWKFGDRAGKQCVGNCVSFLCLSEGKAIEKTTTQDIDFYLTVGSEIYGQAAEHVVQDLLLTADIPKKLRIQNSNYRLQLNPPIVGAVLTDDHLSDALVRAFGTHSAALFICSGKCLAIKCVGGFYFLFDSHSCDTTGFSNSDGRACVIAFVTFATLLHHLLLAFGRNGNIQFEVTPVQIHKTRLKSKSDQLVVCDLRTIKSSQQKALPQPVPGFKACTITKSNSDSGCKSPWLKAKKVKAVSTKKKPYSKALTDKESPVSVTAFAPLKPVPKNTSSATPDDASDTAQSRDCPALTSATVTNSTSVQLNSASATSSTRFAGKRHTIRSWGFQHKRAKKDLEYKLKENLVSKDEAEAYVQSKKVKNQKRNALRQKNRKKRALEKKANVERKLTTKTNKEIPKRNCPRKVVVETIIGKRGNTIYKCKEVIGKGRKERHTRSNTCSNTFRELANRQRDRAQANKLNNLLKRRKNILKTFFSKADVTVKTCSNSPKSPDESSLNENCNKAQGVDSVLQTESTRGLVTEKKSTDVSTVNSWQKSVDQELIDDTCTLDSDSISSPNSYCTANNSNLTTGETVETDNFELLFADVKKQLNEGPVYVCCVCYITLFARGVVPVTPGARAKLIKYLRPDYVAKADLVICHACRKSIDHNNIPSSSYLNGMKFPHLPKVLDIHLDEEKLIALRIPFMQLRLLPKGGQVQLFGNVINVPTEIERGVSLLPRYINDQGTVCVRIKRKLQYKGVYRRLNVDPHRVLSALKYLMDNSDIYRSANVQINENWLEHTIALLDGTATEEANCSWTEADHEEDDVFIDISADETDATIEPLTLNYDTETNKASANNSTSSPSNSGAAEGKSSLPSNFNVDKCVDADTEIPLTVKLDSSSKTSDHNSDTSDNESEDDNFSEVDPAEVSHCLNTLLDDEGSIPYLDVAPGEGQKPLNIVYDEESEEMSFPSVYCGQRIKDIYPQGISFIQRCRWELRSDDRRAAKNSELIFFKYKKYQVLFIYKSALFALRFITKGDQYTANEVLSDSQRSNISCLDDGYYIFRKLRNSPYYLKAKKNELLATIRQRGLPTFFVSLSSADSKWKELIKSIAFHISKTLLSDEDIDKMHYLDKCKILNSDPVTCARYFDSRFKEFLTKVIYHKSNPLGHVVDHFYRIEFQHRGSPHVHMLLFCDDCPPYSQTGDNSDLCSYIDRYVSCSLTGTTSNKPYVHLQVHKHSKTCRKNNKPVCRFGYPLPPFPQTVILQPNSEKTVQDTQNYKRIQAYLDSDSNSDSLDFTQFLKDLSLTYSDYVLAVRASLKSDKVFLKRKPIECRVNMYMVNLLHVWEANVDCQMCLDPYSVVVYISNYINKQQRGLSITLSEVVKECKKKNTNIKETVKALGNVFLKSSEVSVQEAIYMLLGLPLTFLSRDVITVCTKDEKSRAKIVKDKQFLLQCAPDEENIFKDDKFDIYAKRPVHFEEWCLADYCCKVNRIKHNNNNCPGTTITTECTDTEYVYRIRSKDKILSYYSPTVTDDREEFYRILFLIFSPWRTEDNILQFSPTYTEKYQALPANEQTELFARRDYYHKQTVEFIVSETEVDPDDLTTVAPNCAEQNTLDKQTDSVSLSDEHFFQPPKVTDHFCPGTDPGDSNINTAALYSTVERLWPQAQYLKELNSLNKEQRFIHDYILSTCTQGTEVLRLFVTGGAGTGKTKLLKTIYQGLSRFYNLLPYKDPSKHSVLTLAFTGKAAYLINGETIHSCLHISPLTSYAVYNSLPPDTMNSLRSKLNSVSVLVVDEVSLVGCQFLNYINLRLQDIFCSKESFGGLHVIVIGDLYQLPPVRDSWIFQDLSRGIASLGPNLWKEEFIMYELHQIMRQKEDLGFANILSRLRVGTFTTDDLKVLQTRNVPVTPTVTPHSLYLYPTNKEVNALNSLVYSASAAQKYAVSSLDRIVGNYSVKDKKNLLLKAKNSGETHSALQQEVFVCVGLTYDLVYNVNVEDGLANGCSGILRYIQFIAPFEKPAILWLEFLDENIGTTQRLLFKQFYRRDICDTWTPIFPLTQQFTVGRGGISVYRTQFPLKQATAKTVHKSQGSTVTEAVVNLQSGEKFRQLLKHSAYVAISRVTQLKGLTLVNFGPNQIVKDSAVTDEMHRLRSTEIKYFQPSHSSTTLVYYYQNVQHFKPHADCLNHDPTLTKSSIVFLNETHLSSSDTDLTCMRPVYQCIRLDVGVHTKSNAGLLLYIHNDLTVTDSRSYCVEDTEVLVAFIVELNSYVGVYYCKPKAKRQHITKMFEWVRTVTQQTGVQCLIGDLNITNCEASDQNYISVLAQSLNLYLNAFGPTTRWNTTIDYCFSKVPFSVQTKYVPWSHHLSQTITVPYTVRVNNN